jgi:hypothetical protein
MMHTNWLRILLLTLGLVCSESLMAGLQPDTGTEIVQALSGVEKLLPDEVQFPRPLLSALSGYAKSPTPALQEVIAARRRFLYDLCFSPFRGYAGFAFKRHGQLEADQPCVP